MPRGEASLGQSRLASAATNLPSPPSAPVSNADVPAIVPVSNADGPATNHAQSSAVGGGAADEDGFGFNSEGRWRRQVRRGEQRETLSAATWRGRRETVDDEDMTAEDIDNVDLGLN